MAMIRRLGRKERLHVIAGALGSTEETRDETYHSWHELIWLFDVCISCAIAGFIGIEALLFEVTQRFGSHSHDLTFPRPWKEVSRSVTKIG